MKAPVTEKDIPTKALVVEKPGAPFILKDVILDEVRVDELLIEIKYAGLCHTVGDIDYDQWATLLTFSTGPCCSSRKNADGLVPDNLRT